MSTKRIITFLIIAALVASFFIFDLGQYLTLEYMKAKQAELEGFRQENPFGTAAAFFLVYVA
ncbi:MAG: hypothetical protein ABW120_12240, partial [Sedimenticola sp.]